MTTPFYLQDEWIKIITETANDYCLSKGYATKIKTGQTEVVLIALSLVQKASETMKELALKRKAVNRENGRKSSG